MTDKPRGKMLIAVPDRWDEACFSIPAVRAMSACGFDVSILCDERKRPLWETIPEISIVGFSEKSGSKVLAAALDGKWDAAILWEPGIAADAILRAKINRRIGPGSPELKKFLTHPVDLTRAPGPVEHRVRHYLSLVEKLGAETGKPEFFAAAAIPQPVEGAVLLCPDSDFGKTYEWHLERWIELARLLAADGLTLTIAGLAGRDGGKALAAALGEKARFIELEPLAGGLDIFGAQELVIAAESSLPHLAAHSGATCVTLFGPGDPTSRRPLGRRHAIARRHVECAPCFLTKCPMDLRCQNDLAVERVLAAVRAALPQRAAV